MRLPNDGAKPITTGTDKLACFIERHGDIAVVLIYGKPSPYEIDFRDVRADYETLSRGAAQSARKEVRRLLQATEGSS